MPNVVEKGRTKDAIIQIEKGLEEARAVGEVVISNRLRRLQAQVRAWLHCSKYVTTATSFRQWGFLVLMLAVVLTPSTCTLHSPFGLHVQEYFSTANLNVRQTAVTNRSSFILL